MDKSWCAFHCHQQHHGLSSILGRGQLGKALLPIAGGTMKRQPEYSCYAELEETEEEGIHFDRIGEPRVNAQVVVIAPHAGKIEPRTGPIAQKIAGTKLSLYRFIGRRPETKGRKSLHMRSENF